MLLPLPNPNTTEKMITATMFPFAGIQMASTEIKQRMLVRINVLNRPIRSATIPGSHRPGKDPALRKTTIRYDMRGDIPLAIEYEAMYSSGMKKPHSMKNTPIVVSARIGSLRIVRSGRKTLRDGAAGTLDGGKFARTKIRPGIRRMSVIRPTTRLAHANPISGARFAAPGGRSRRRYFHLPAQDQSLHHGA